LADLSIINMSSTPRSVIKSQSKPRKFSKILKKKVSLNPQ